MLQRLASALQHQPERTAVLSVGIDRLSLVNHALTHRVGDRLILTVAERLVQTLAADGQVGRGTGDTFIVLLTGLRSSEEASAIAERLRQGVKGVITAAGHRLNPSVSIGLARPLPPPAGDNRSSEASAASADELLRDAALAMRLAGEKGRDRCQIADQRLALQARQNLQLQDELRQAVERGALQAWLMPQVDLGNAQLQGYEALVRWPRSDGQLALPDSFLTIARSCDLGEAIDLAMLRQSIDALVQLPPPLSVAVNLSPATLCRPGLAEQVLHWLQTAGVEPQRLHLEITETALLQIGPEVRGAIQTLAAAGVRWLVDDFGVGYSSISHLRDLPIHGIKLDGSFTVGLRHGDQKSLRLAQGLAGLAEGLGLLTVAEGIETAEEAATLRDLGWSSGQGWHFGKAAPLQHWCQAGLPAAGSSRPMAASGSSRSRWALAVTDNVPVGLFALHLEAGNHPRFQFVSRRWLELLQLQRHQARRGMAPVLARVHPQDRATLIALCQQQLQCGSPFRWEGRLQSGRGQRWVLLDAAPLEQGDGSRIWQGVISDITERKEQELYLRFLLEEAPIPIAIQELGGVDPQITFVNQQFRRVFGYDLSTIPRLSEWARLAYPDPQQRQAVFQAWDASVAAASSGDHVVPPLEAEVTAADGSQRRALFTAVMRGESEMVISAMDITAWRQAEAQLQQARASLAEHALALTEAIPVGTYTMHLPPEGGMASFGFMSERFLQICGLNRDEAAADPFQAFACVHPDDYDAWVQWNADAFAQKRPFYGECRVVADGVERWISAESVPRDLPDGSTVWEGVLIDISQRKQVEQQLIAANTQLQELAHTDGLTGVWNRRHLEGALQQAMQRQDRHGGALALILCDVDHFKHINDRHGHPGGDQVLIEFCRRIQQHLRSGDCFGRWGGEEFLILLDPGDTASAAALAEKLRRLIAATPFARIGTVTASFGVAERRPAESAADWFQRVDQCVYAAKQAGRNRVIPAGASAAPD